MDKSPVLTIYSYNLKEVKKQAILGAIKLSEGNLTYAMELLNCSKQKMYTFINEYDLYDMVNKLRENRHFSRKLTRPHTKV